MNYAFKIISVVLALGVLVLQGCTNSYDNYNQAEKIANLTDKELMQYACNNGLWRINNSEHVLEAKKRSLVCGIEGVANTFSVFDTSSKTNSETTKPKISSIANAEDSIKTNSETTKPKISSIANAEDSIICFNATILSGSKKIWNKYREDYVFEAQYRKLDCGVHAAIKEKNEVLRNIFYNFSNKKICLFATKKIKNYQFREWDFKRFPKHVLEAKSRGLDCGVKENKTIIASKPETKTYIQSKPTISSAELDAERTKRKELERRLVALEAKQKQEQQRISSDNQEPTISAFTKQNGSNAIISGRVTDNTEVAEVLIDGEQLSLDNSGTFKTELYIPRNGLNIEIVAYDRKGNKAFKLLKIERDNIQQASGPIFDTLNPSVKRVKSNPNALALIIGVANYSKTNANALYADKDAQQFYDYATMKLGVSSSNIKELINDKADESEILLSVKEWLRRSAKPNKSDIYVFFAGHGLASQDGKNMYLLPHDGSPRLLEKTAILRNELFFDIKQSNPKSVTVFLDTCYSGVTRNEEMLIAGRPIVIKAKEQAIPDGFTLFSAASNEQISRPLEEAKHGMFSYFLMKGMEGDADTNNDNKITARELHAYVEQNVVQQSSGSQTPELQGDKDRVLVQFN